MSVMNRNHRGLTVKVSRKMADSKVVKTKIQELLAKFGIKGLKLSVEETKMVSTETEDGKTIYTTDDWKEGMEVFSDEEMKTPVADGDYLLKTGETIVITSGKISSIKPPEEEMKTEEVTEALAALETKLEETSTELAAKETELASKEVELSSLKAKLATAEKENKELKLKAVPSAKDKQKHSKVDAPVSGKKYSEMSMQEKIHFNREQALSKN